LASGALRRHRGAGEHQQGGPAHPCPSHRRRILRRVHRGTQRVHLPGRGRLADRVAGAGESGPLAPAARHADQSDRVDQRRYRLGVRRRPGRDERAADPMRKAADRPGRGCRLRDPGSRTRSLRPAAAISRRRGTDQRSAAHHRVAQPSPVRPAAYVLGADRVLTAQHRTGRHDGRGRAGPPAAHGPARDPGDDGSQGKGIAVPDRAAAAGRRQVHRAGR